MQIERDEHWRNLAGLRNRLEDVDVVECCHVNNLQNLGWMKNVDNCRWVLGVLQCLIHVIGEECHHWVVGLVE